MSSFTDFIYPSAYSRGMGDVGVILPSTAEAKSVSFPDAQPVVFLPEINQLEIQRASSQKIACMVTVNAMQQSFNLFKFPNVHYLHVPFSHNPIIDMGWIGKACEEENRTIVFSLPDWLRVFQKSDVRLLETYHRLVRLLYRKKIPYLFASFAKNEEMLFSPIEKEAVSVFFLTETFPEKDHSLRVELNSHGGRE